MRRTAWAIPSGIAITHSEAQRDADEDEVVRELVDDERVDALVQPVGIPEVPVQDMGEERQVLRDDRAIKPVHAVERGDLAGIRPGPEDGAREAAGDHVLEHEHEHRQAEQDDHGLNEAAQCEPDHVRSCSPFRLGPGFNPSRSTTLPG